MEYGIKVVEVFKKCEMETMDDEGLVERVIKKIRILLAGLI